MLHYPLSGVYELAVVFVVDTVGEVLDGERHTEHAAERLLNGHDAIVIRNTALLHFRLAQAVLALIIASTA